MTSLSRKFSTTRCSSRASILVALAFGVLAGCTGESHTAPKPKPIANESGDRQTGLPSHALPEPLVIRVLDVEGPRRGRLTVHWTTDDGGSFSPQRNVDRRRGARETTWTLGLGLGNQHAHAMIAALSSDDFTATSTSELPLTTGVLPLALSTYDGSGQTVHPDSRRDAAVLARRPSVSVDHAIPARQRGLRESIALHRRDFINWTPPSGVSNPIASPDDGYLSDPDIVSVPELNELWVYYRKVTTQNEIDVIRSRDGVTFTAPHRVAAAPNHDIVSPAVVHRGVNDWMMWSVNSNVGCYASQTTVELRRSSDGIGWSAPQTVQLSQSGGFSPWHIDVQWIPSRTNSGPSTTERRRAVARRPPLFLATSPDGVRWTTYPSPILSRGASDALADVVYRSTFAYDPATDLIDFWYSGAKYDFGQYVWHSAYQRRTRSEVFATAAKKNAAAVAALAPRRDIPPLADPP